MSNPSFRFPNPRVPVERFDVRHPSVPPGVEGWKVLHLSDLHVSHAVRGRKSWQGLLDAVDRTPADVVALTGDYMTHPGDEVHAARALRDLLGAVRSRHGVFGVFGNHDSPRFKTWARGLAGVEWLENRCADLEHMVVLGASEPEDLFSARLGHPAPGRFTLGLAHTPSALFAAADLGVDVILLGHTHGGQVRVGARWIGYTAGEVPGALANGMVRRGGTLACITRGVGVGRIRVRVNCPMQAPEYTLRRGAMMGTGRGGCERVLAW